MTAPARSRVTTHVLDAALGRPAQGVRVRLERADAVVPTPVVTSAEAPGTAGWPTTAWTPVAQGVTDADGRVGALGPEDLEVGVYRIILETGQYFTDTAQEGFYPEVTVTFYLRDPRAHHHVPLLLSPYAYSTYRGS